MLAGLSLSRFDLFSSVLVTLVGLKQIAGPWTSMELLRKVGFIETTVALIVLASLLARYWLPLGPESGTTLNLCFVFVLLTLVMGTFKLFEMNYPAMLGWVLNHKRGFMIAPFPLGLYGMCGLAGLQLFLRCFTYILTEKWSR